MKPDMLKHLRVISLSEINDNTYHAWYKSICRWYSREFHTPLSDVMEMSDENVIQTYYDDAFWALKHGDTAQQEVFLETIDGVINEESPQVKTIHDQANEEDDEWYEKELAEIDKKFQAAEKTKKSKKSKQISSESIKPNLPNDAQNIFVEANDQYVSDDEES